MGRSQSSSPQGSNYRHLLDVGHWAVSRHIHRAHTGHLCAAHRWQHSAQQVREFYCLLLLTKKSVKLRPQRMRQAGMAARHIAELCTRAQMAQLATRRHAQLDRTGRREGCSALPQIERSRGGAHHLSHPCATLTHARADVDGSTRRTATAHAHACKSSLCYALSRSNGSVDDEGMRGRRGRSGPSPRRDDGDVPAARTQRTKSWRCFTAVQGPCYHPCLHTERITHACRPACRTLSAARG